MKKLIITVLALILFDSVFGQYVILTPPDKAVVYFVRTDRAMKGASLAPLIFDSRETVSRIVPASFYRYECEPGEHLFWLNKGLQMSWNMEMITFCEANLQAGKIYLILVKTKPFKGGRFYPINPEDDWENIEKIRSVMDNRSSIEFSDDNELGEMNKTPKYYENSITKILEKYYPKHKAKNKVVVLDPAWYVSREELMYGKKKGDSEL